MILAAVYHDDPSRRIHVQVGDEPVRIGRNPKVEMDGRTVGLQIPWPDRIVNRDHSTAHRCGDELVLERIPVASDRKGALPNPFYSNAPAENRIRLDDPLRLAPGDSFVIGARGRTTFFWLNDLDELERLLENDGAAPEPRHREFQRSGDAAVHYDDVAELDEYSMRLQLKLLQKELPEKVLGGWTDEADLLTRTSDFLQSALPGQKGVSVAFIALNRERPDDPFEILHANTSSRANFRPSRTLVRQLLEVPVDSEQAHIWSSEEHYADLSGVSFVGQVDWVVALPLSSLEENATVYRDDRDRPVFLYVETRRASNASARVFVPFLQLITSIVSSLLSSRRKQRVQDQLSAYFSPALRRLLQTGDESALGTTMADCTVLFCDRQGSSRGMEQAKSDKETLARLEENQAFVNGVTNIVFEHDGVVTDFAGDGVLALWGWPESAATCDGNHAACAVRAAETIAAGLQSALEFDPASGRPIAAFRIGISSGRIAVGKTGPAQQMHISCFGTVVNFGSRLEGLGKQFHVPVLLSEETTSLIRGAGLTVRKLCYMKPAGFDNAYPIFELVLPREQGGSGATSEHIEIYEEALHRFLLREWERCLELLKPLPIEDEPAHWLARQASHFLDHEPAGDWAGEIVSLSK